MISHWPVCTAAVVGAPDSTDPSNPGTTPGAAYIFERSSVQGTWGSSIALQPPSSGGPAAGENFGIATAISGDGNLIVVGCPQSPTPNVPGTAYYIWKPAGGWSTAGQMSILDPTPSLGASKVNYGNIVATSFDGKLVIGKCKSLVWVW